MAAAMPPIFLSGRGIESPGRLECSYCRPDLKDQTICWLPLVVGFWSRGLPATSFAPVVTTALYLVLFARSVVEVPNGLSVAFRPSVLGVTVTLAIWVVLPSVLTLKSWKVVVVSVLGFIFSEKVAVRLVLRLTPVALLAGVTLLTLGAAVSTTVQVRLAGVGSAMPSALTARTR